MKPGDLYLGVVDFFAIVLPGAIAVAYLDHVGGRGYSEKMLPTESFSGFGGWVGVLLRNCGIDGNQPLGGGARRELEQPGRGKRLIAHDDERRGVLLRARGFGLA